MWLLGGMKRHSKALSRWLRQLQARGFLCEVGYEGALSKSRACDSPLSCISVIVHLQRGVGGCLAKSAISRAWADEEAHWHFMIKHGTWPTLTAADVSNVVDLH